MKIIVNKLDKTTINQIAHEYLAADYISLKAVALKHYSTAATISNILWRGIAENILNTDISERIYTKIVAKPSQGWYQRKLRWDKAFDKRDELIYNTKKND